MLETIGALQLSGMDVTLNQVVSRADLDAGNLTFMPVVNTNGIFYNSFEFVVSDGPLESSPVSSMVVDITAVNDAPIITSGGGGLNAILHMSNQLSSVMTVEASDVESSEQNLSFSIIGGVDSEEFLIDVETGELSLVVASGLEMLLDSSLDNIYEVAVQVSDGAGGIATQLIQVVVDQPNQIFPSNQQQSVDSDEPNKLRKSIARQWNVWSFQISKSHPVLA